MNISEFIGYFSLISGIGAVVIYTIYDWTTLFTLSACVSILIGIKLIQLSQVKHTSGESVK